MNLYSTAYKFLAGFIRWFYNIKITGAENEPSDGAFLVCSNHLSNHDPVIIAASLKRQVRFLAKAELFRIPGLKQLITALGAFPVDRAKSDVGSIKRTISLLEGGEVVGFYPQGTRYPGVHPSSTTPHNGVGLITYRAKVKVLPVLIKTKNYRILPFRRIDIIIGKPIEYDELNFERGVREEYTAAAKYIFKGITDLDGE